MLEISYDDNEWTPSHEEFEKGEDEDQGIRVQSLVHNPRIPSNKMEPHLEKYESLEQLKFLSNKLCGG